MQTLSKMMTLHSSFSINTTLFFDISVLGVLQLVLGAKPCIGAKNMSKLKIEIFLISF